MEHIRDFLVELGVGFAFVGNQYHTDAPTICILLCKAKNNVIVEYALRDMAKPISVAGWETQLVESLPKELEGRLPTVEQLGAELAEDDDGTGNQQEPGTR